MNTIQKAMLDAGILKKEDIDNQDISTNHPVSGQDAIEYFSSASPDNLMFAIITVLNTDIYTGNTMTAWKGLVACTGIEKLIFEDNKYDTHIEPGAHFVTIEDGEQLHDINFGYKLSFSKGFLGLPNNFIINDICYSTPELIEQYNEVCNSITAKIHWCDYYETPDAYNIYREIPGTKQSETIHAKTLNDAEKWLLQNHPGQYMGHSILMSNGGFSFSSIPCSEYPEGQYENRENRMKYAINEAKKLNCQCGDFDYSLANQIENNNEVDIEM